MSAEFEHCRELLRAADRDRFLATLYAPETQRPALHALYAFDIELAGVRDRAREPMPAEIRLQWWREVLDGRRNEEAKANPVAAALREIMARYSIPPAPLIGLIEARAFDLYDDPMATVGELEAYARKTDAAVLEIATGILAGGNPDIDELVFHAGAAQAIQTLLRRFPLHAARRQLYLPLEIVRRHGADPEEIFAGKATAELRAALADMRVRARRHLAEAGRMIAAARPAIMPALLPLALVRPTLGKMERRDYQPFQPAGLPHWRRQWLLWRAARNPWRIFA